MDRIKTRIIIAVAERLGTAKDSNTKTELIEELSENLYQRYTDFVGAGATDEEAYLRAMENLGDVSELLAYLGNLEEPVEPDNQSDTKEPLNDFIRGVEDVARETLVQAKDAVDQVKVITRDLTQKFNEKFPNGINIQLCGVDIIRSHRNHRGHFTEVANLLADNIRGFDIQLHNGDVDLHVATQDRVVVSSDAEGLEVHLDDNGVLYIRQGNTAASSVAFGRGLVRTDVVLTIPDKAWEFIRINTVNGDVELADTLETGDLSIQTVNGDISAAHTCCPQMLFKSVSGDISGEELAGNVEAETKSGDVSLTGRFVAVKTNSMSGDVELRGTANLVHCSSMSGDVDAEIKTLPLELHAESKSGDCCVRIPEGQGFTVALHTVSGDLSTDFELVGTIGRKSSNAVYLDGGDRNFSISSISGDISLEKI